MRISLVAVGILVTLVLAGCSGGAGLTPTPVSPEYALQQRAEAANTALSASKWLDYYKYTSPRFRELCLSGQFATQTGTAMVMLRSLMGIEEDESLKWNIARVTAEDDEGRVFGDILYKGEPIDFGGDDKGTRWVFFDGEWWQEDEDWNEGCPGLGFDGGTDTRDSSSLTSTPTPPPALSLHALGEPVTVDAGLLSGLMGEPELTGQVVLTFISSEGAVSVEDSLYGTVDAEGVFLVVHFSVANEANSRIQPSTQINDDFSLVDERGRQWAPAGYLTHGFDVAEAFADQAGENDPKGWVAPGFTRTTAIAFDIPEGASGLRLRSERLGMEVALGN